LEHRVYFIAKKQVLDRNRWYVHARVCKLLRLYSIYHNTGQLGIIGIALVHALVLMAITNAIGYCSGAQVNAAVTIGLLAAGKLRPKEAAL
jgi:glycerol uptake facilitator-like aquaporin